MLLLDASRQAAFAKLSGDHNPLHVDPDDARRTQFGSAVVHGVHLVLAALESLDLVGPTRLMFLDAEFRAAVLVGEVVTFDTEPARDEGQQINVRVEGQLRAVVTTNTASIDSVGAAPVPPQWSTTPVELSDFDELSALTGREPLGLDTRSFGELFPSLAASLSAVDAATLLGTTRVIGMHCPGRWALFRRLRWQLADNDGGPAATTALDYHVAAERRRFAMLTVALSAGDRRLEAETIVRDAPPRQASMQQIRQHVDPTEFAGVRALIVGGSRGLGELTAKVLAAGSAQVLLTYRRGAQDAAAIATQIGPGSDVTQLDIEDMSADSLDHIHRFEPTHVSYFATPLIAKRPANSWDSDIYEQFVRVYVTGLSKLLSLVDSTGALDSVMFPSSTFVEDQPTGFAEYVAAKLAGEELCRAWQLIRPDQRILIERFPPLVTDQTAARLGSDAASNLDALLPVLRQLATA